MYIYILFHDTTFFDIFELNGMVYTGKPSSSDNNVCKLLAETENYENKLIVPRRSWKKKIV